MLKEWYSFIFLYPNSQDILNRKSKLQDNTLGKKKKNQRYMLVHTYKPGRIYKNPEVFSGKGKIREIVLIMSARAMLIK